MKKKLLLLFILAAVLGLSACSSSKAGNAEVPASAEAVSSADSESPADTEAPKSIASPEEGHPSFMTRPEASSPSGASAESGRDNQKPSSERETPISLAVREALPEEEDDTALSRLPEEEGFFFDKNTLPSRTILYQDNQTVLTIQTKKKGKDQFQFELLAENRAKNTRSVILRNPSLSSWALEFDRYLDIPGGGSESVEFSLTESWFAGRRLDTFRDFAMDLEILEDYTNIDICRITAFLPVPEEEESAEGEESGDAGTAENPEDAEDPEESPAVEEPVEQDASEASDSPEDPFSPPETKELFNREDILISSVGLNYTGEDEYALLLENDSGRTLLIETSDVTLDGRPAEDLSESALCWPSTRNLLILPVNPEPSDNPDSAGGFNPREITFHLVVKDLHSGEVLEAR